MLPVGKGSLVQAVFHPQLGNVRITLGLDYSSSGDKESTELVPDLLPPLGIPVPVSDSAHDPLSCSSVCIMYIWSTSLLCLSSVAPREGCTQAITPQGPSGGSSRS